jgi:hypothetical protein
LVKNYKYWLFASAAGYCGDGSPIAGFTEGIHNAVCQPSPLPSNTWTHLAATYNGSILTLYRNGVAVGATTVSSTLSPTTGTLQIGASQDGAYFKGLIDEVRIYNKALSATEIQNIYQQDSAIPVQTVTTPTISPNAKLFLSWQDTSGNEDNFQIERKTSTNGSYVQIALVGPGVTSYEDSDLIDGTTYCYRVSALNSAGTSGYSNEACDIAP